MLKTFSIDSRIRHAQPITIVDSPIVIRVSKFDEDAGKEFVEQMNKAVYTKQPVIPIVIDSYGGECYSLIDMITQMQNSPVPIATIVEGKAMSCGALLFGMGTPGYRYVGPHATVMLHEVSSGYWGKVTDIQSSVAQSSLINKKLFKILSNNCGHTDDYFLDLIHAGGHTDLYFNPSECLDHKIADFVGIPELKTTVSVSYDFIAPKQKV